MMKHHGRLFRIEEIMYMHGGVHGNAPDQICNLITLTGAEDVAYNFRKKENVKHFRIRTDKFRKSSFSDCIRKWNELP